jgi:hypothetical protein
MFDYGAGREVQIKRTVARRDSTTEEGGENPETLQDCQERDKQAGSGPDTNE